MASHVAAASRGQSRNDDGKSYCCAGVAVVHRASSKQLLHADLPLPLLFPIYIYIVAD